ncbi:hypothetical protein [Arenibacter sp. F20364]|uniref:hypothetical protein n=1 Tax=Arenibacter sp. F20364 TaxID=2926415 RepID=UPI001FF398D5|nr:hypothetical protein [Arenibacter sp. F20364]MCK0189420.1 hypothetical protein [Arenibacter sp. F20364]
MGGNFSEGHIGDDDFSLIISIILHPAHSLPWKTPLFFTTFFSIGIVIDSHGIIKVDDLEVTIKPNCSKGRSIEYLI